MPAGVAAEAENTSVRLARELANAGADGLVIPPPIAPTPQSKLVRYFEVAAGAPPGRSAASDSE